MCPRIDPKSERMKSSDCRLLELHVVNNDSWAYSGSSSGVLFSISRPFVHGFKACHFLDGGHVFRPCAFRGQIWAMISLTSFVAEDRDLVARVATRAVNSTI